MVCIFLCLNGVEQPFSPKNRWMSEAIGSVVAAQITSNRWTLAATFKMGNGACSEPVDMVEAWVIGSRRHEILCEEAKAKCRIGKESGWAVAARKTCSGVRVAVTAASLLKHSKKGKLGRVAVVRKFRIAADVECWKASLCVWKSQNGNSKADRGVFGGFWLGWNTEVEK